MYTANVRMKLKAATTERVISWVVGNPHNIIEETNALQTNMPITTTTTRFWVTSSWYLRCSEQLRTRPHSQPQHQRGKQLRRNGLKYAAFFECYSQVCPVVATWLGRRCIMLDQTNQQQHQSTRDSAAAEFLKLFPLLMSCVWHRLSQYSTWRWCKLDNCRRIQLAIKVERRSLSSAYLRYNWDPLQNQSLMTLTH